MKITLKNTFLTVFFSIAIAVSGCGNETKTNPAEADIKNLSLESLIAASDKGNTEAKFTLGIKYLEGKSVEKNIERSISLLEEAAVSGYEKAMYQLYLIHVGSEYGMESSQKADSWLLKAAETGNPEYELKYATRKSYYYQGKVYFFANPKEEDLNQFAKWIKLASEKKNLDAMMRYGVVLLTGLTTENLEKRGIAYDGGPIKTIIQKDVKTGIDLLTESADKGNWLSQHALANIYQSGAIDIPANKDISDKYWLILRQSTNGKDIRSLAWTYNVFTKASYKDSPRKFEGKVLTFEESQNLYFELMKRAADLDDSIAMEEVAQAYVLGKGTYKNIESAALYYRKAADKGNFSAQTNLAYLYIEGQGVPKDYELAKSWLLKAVSDSSPNKWSIDAGWSKALLGYLGNHGKGTDGDSVVAYAWYNLAAADGYQKAKQNLIEVESLLSKEELKEAQQLSREWKPGQDILRIRMLEKDRPNNSGAVSGSLKLSSVGSGFFIDKSGIIITNNHVIQDCKDIKITAKNVSAKMVVADRSNDIAILKIDSVADDYLEFFSDSIKQGEDVFAFGFPLDGYLPSSGNITQGIVSALSGPANNSSLIQITTPVQSGNSGGPLLNKKGLVVGQVVGKANAIRIAKVTGDIPQNVNFAISHATIKSFLKANNQKFSESQSIFTFSKNTVDIAEMAKKASSKVECWK